MQILCQFRGPNLRGTLKCVPKTKLISLSSFLLFSASNSGSERSHKEKKILPLSSETAHMQELHPHPQGVSKIMATYDPRDSESITHWSGDVSPSMFLERGDTADLHRWFFLPLCSYSLRNASHRSCSGSLLSFWLRRWFPVPTWASWKLPWNQTHMQTSLGNMRR